MMPKTRMFNIHVRCSIFIIGYYGISSLPDKAEHCN